MDGAEDAAVEVDDFLEASDTEVYPLPLALLAVDVLRFEGVLEDWVGRFLRKDSGEATRRIIDSETGLVLLSSQSWIGFDMASKIREKRLNASLFNASNSWKRSESILYDRGTSLNPRSITATSCRQSIAGFWRSWQFLSYATLSIVPQSLSAMQNRGCNQIKSVSAIVISCSCTHRSRGSYFSRPSRHERMRGERWAWKT